MSTISSHPYLQVFEPPIKAHGPSTFHLFPQLPTELRLKIWRHSLEKERIIHVHLIRKPVYAGALAQHFTETHYAYPDTGEHFWTFAGGYQTMSKLLRVSSEAREVALRFYRVRIPCRLASAPEDVSERNFHHGIRPGTLYFNPEYDFLQVNIASEVGDCLVEFLHYLKTVYDPIGVGLLNLAADLNNIGSFKESDMEDIESPSKESFLATINQLQEVFILHKLAVGRRNTGLLGGMTVNDVFFNGSLPIMPLHPHFERLGTDPRPIKQDLARVYLGNSSPPEALDRWRIALMQWGLDPDQSQAKVSYLVAFSQGGGEDAVYDRETATRWLQKEYEMWEEELMRRLLVKEPEVLENVVTPALGFWLFPADTFHPPPTNEEDTQTDASTFRICVPQNLSAHWPILALSSLT